MNINEINNVSEMLQGCNEAIVNYALTDDMKLVRMVIFYNSSDSNFEDILPLVTLSYKKQGNISIVKSLIYKILSLTKVLKSINFHSILFKDIPGFTPDPDFTDDCRTSK